MARHVIRVLALTMLLGCAEQMEGPAGAAISTAGNQCFLANDGKCDESGFGVGACAPGTDSNDCQGSGAALGPNSCLGAFNGQCDEPGVGTGMCAPATDAADCRGDYGGVLFGNDDRVVVDSTQYPWSAIGRVISANGGSCTGSMVAPRLVLTSAQCLYLGPGSIKPDNMPVAFLAGADEWGYLAAARVIGVELPRQHNYRRWLQTSEIDGLDWAFLVLDRNVGQAVGILDVLPVSQGDLEQAVGRNWFELSQAGYSTDRGDNLTAHIDCRITTVHADQTIFHECDTLFGDAGSPLFVKDGEFYRVIAVDSSSYANDAGVHPQSNMAVDSRAIYKTFQDLTESIRVNAGAPGWPLRRLPGGLAIQPNATPFGTGTGFYINRDGDMVTNFHVINTCAAVGVKTDDTILPAEVIAFDRRLDIAVLRTPTLPGGIVPLRSAPAPTLGQQVFAVGYPLFGELALVNFTDGLVSSLAGFRGNAQALQTSAAIQPGNSGGPLLDRSGAVVGIITSGIRGAENISFAVRADSMIDVLRRDGVAFERAGPPRQVSTEVIASQAADFTYPVLCYAGE